MAGALALLVAFVGLPFIALALAAAPASAATATGTGGLYVPVATRLVDSRYGIGLNGQTGPLTGGQWYTIQAEGAPGIPSSGVGSLQITLTTVNPTGEGFVNVSPTDSASYSALSYDANNGTLISNTATVALASDGSFGVMVYATTDLVIDVQGYYTSGSTAAGGYVPSDQPWTLGSTFNGTNGLPQAPLGNGAIVTMQVTGQDGVPAGATSAFLNFEVFNHATSAGGFQFYDANGNLEPTSLNFDGNANSALTTALGTVVQLNASGQLKFKFYDASGTADLTVNTEGYFLPGNAPDTAKAGAGSFTPASTPVTGASGLTIPAWTTSKVLVAGVNGIPALGTGINAAGLNVAISHTGSAGGSVNVHGDGGANGDETRLDFPIAGPFVESDYLNIALGPNGAIDVQNLSNDPITVYIGLAGWYSAPSAVVSNGQSTTKSSVPLQAFVVSAVAAGRPWVTYKYRVGATGTYTNIPTGSVSPAVSSWPVQATGSGLSASTTQEIWDVAGTLNTQAAQLVQVQACFGTSSNDANPLCTVPSNVVYTTAGFGSSQATTHVGPGTLSLATGDYLIGSADASVSTSLGGLSIGRDLTTRIPAAAAGAAGVFGPGWAADFAGPGAGEADLTVTDLHGSGYLVFTDASGSVTVFEQVIDPSNPNPATASYVPVGDDATSGATVTLNSADTAIVWNDPDGTITTWTKASGVWQPTVQEPSASTGATPSTTTTYHFGSGDTAGLVDHIIAPTPRGLSTTCTDANANTTPGCRSLVLNYGPAYGTSLTRLLSVDFVLGQADPQPVTLIAYEYDTSGRLIDSFDPKMGPFLKTSYTYATSGTGLAAATRLASLTPPGQNPWSFNYDSTGRLSSVSRTVPVTDPANPGAGTTDQAATSTIVYGVPTSSTGAITGLPDLTTMSTRTWNETTDLPVDCTTGTYRPADCAATAVFPPDHPPAGSTPATVGTADWAYATLHYLDSNSREVNTASNGGGPAGGSGQWLISTAQYDSNGHDYWDLTAGNRAQALATTADTDPYVDAVTCTGAQATLAGCPTVTAARADLLASKTLYNPGDPTEVTATYGPTHPVTLTSGTTIDARIHTSTFYDAGAPNNDVDPKTGQAYRLVTSVSTRSFDVSTGADVATAWDTSWVANGYSASVGADGWSLRQPTWTQVQGSSRRDGVLTLQTTMVYDADGRTTQVWLPTGNGSNNSPGATDTTYYTPTGSSPCGGTAEAIQDAGRVCTTAPGAQPSGNPLPTTSYTYTAAGSVATKTETYGSPGSGTPTRTTTITHDASERVVATSVTVANGPSGSQSVPSAAYGYAWATGLPTTTSTGSGSSQVTLTTGYDAAGRPNSYTDATGNVSQTGYDVDGRPITQADGKGTTTLTYDSTGEHRGLVTSENIGAPSGTPSTFTASYNTAGSIAAETYPNGLVAATSYDNAGNPTALAYAKGGSTWLAFTATNGDGDRTIANTSTVAGTAYSNQTYAYDGVGRLLTVQDTAPGAGAAGCVTRVYGLTGGSDRTSLASYPAGSAGVCSTTTTATTSTYSYDTADRLTSDTAGAYSYDTFGRTTSMPAGDASGIGSHATITGPLSVNYYDNDMVLHQAQGTGTTAATIDYGLDPMQSRILSETENDGTGTSSAQTVVTTNHYADGSDSPAWTGVATTPAGGSTTNTWTRNINGIDGNLAATIDQTGNVVLQLTNLHGDICATAPDSTTATAVAGYWETTEYGTPRNTAAAPSTYGWHGGKKRSANALGGIALMGVRLYSSATGRFLSPDPIAGGNANAYTFPLDPINQSDDTGKLSIKVKKKKILGVTVATIYTVEFTQSETKTIADLSIPGVVGYVSSRVQSLTTNPEVKAAVAATAAVFAAAMILTANYAIANGDCLRYTYVSTPLKYVHPAGQGGFLHTGSCP